MADKSSKKRPLKYVIRVGIRQTGAKWAGLTLYRITPKEAVLAIQKVIDAQHLSLFTRAKVTSIEVRKNSGHTHIGKTIYFSFRGISPVKTRDLLKKSLESAKENIT